MCAAPVGNQFWKARTTHGRDLIFKDKDILWEACVEYFEWVEEHPLKAEKVFCNQGEITYAEVSKMRAMTIAGMCIFLDIDVETWHRYRKRDDFCAVIKNAEQIIYDQKFTGASADLLNANIIARDLGLKDVSAREHTGKDGGPIETSELTDREKARRIAFALSKGAREVKPDESEDN